MKTKLLLIPLTAFAIVTALVLAPIGFEPVEPTSAASETEKLPERIPFTNKPVVAGDPESYIGTYGQCPFYENAMEKGCYPPSDITCNADWSKCELKKESEPTNVISEPNDTRSTPSKEEQPSGCFSSK